MTDVVLSIGKWSLLDGVLDNMEHGALDSAEFDDAQKIRALRDMLATQYPYLPDGLWPPPQSTASLDFPLVTWLDVVERLKKHAADLDFAMVDEAEGAELRDLAARVAEQVTDAT